MTHMDEQILSLYTKGMISREIVAFFKEIYDANFSTEEQSSVVVFNAMIISCI